MGETRIKAGAKIDNLVQVGHGVTIGRNALMAAQVGISGSTSIGDDVTFVLAKRPGSRTARLLCDSAAKFTIVSTPSSSIVLCARSRSPMSPWTNTMRPSTSARLARFPAYVSRS